MGVQRCQPSASCCDWVRATSTGPKTQRKAPLASQNNPTRMIASCSRPGVLSASPSSATALVARHGPAVADSRPAPDAAHLCSPRRLTQCRCAIAARGESSSALTTPQTAAASRGWLLAARGRRLPAAKPSGTGASGAPLEQSQRQRLICSATAELGLTKGPPALVLSVTRASPSAERSMSASVIIPGGRWTHGARWQDGGQPVIGEYFIIRGRP